MRVLFITTPSNDCFNHVRAWRSFAPADHYVMKCLGIRIEWHVTQAVRDYKADIVFYISANQGPYALKINTLKEIRAILKEKNTVSRFVNLCSDAADRPWHGVLAAYKKHGCFDLQVSIDGGRPTAIDLSTLTPIDPVLYNEISDRDIRCGFSGNPGYQNSRSEILKALEWFGNLTIRVRSPKDGYEDHVKFLKRCRMILNISRTGSDQAHHIKGRVLESGWAGCALLESAGSPIGEWFPEDCYFTWKDAKEAADIIKNVSDEEITHRAARLAEEVRSRFTPEKIYGEMLKRIGL
jgi:hypothetical protein